MVAVDWSGASSVATQREHIWVAEIAEGELVDLDHGRTRKETIDHLVDLLATSEQVVVGLDFSFSFPVWFLRDRGIDRIENLWRVAGTEGEGWLRKCQPPFWGRPGVRRPEMESHLRLTENAFPAVAGIRPKSTFQVGGAGSVGTGSIRGMPHLLTLREAGFAVWPFHVPGRAVVFEMYPRALTGPVRKSDPEARRAALTPFEMAPTLRARAEGSEDAFDAAVSAIVMNRSFSDISTLAPADDPVVQLEGSIWVPAGPAGADGSPRTDR